MSAFEIVLFPASDSTAALKKEISRILLSAINGGEPRYRLGDYIRWGLVEREIHEAIDGLKTVTLRPNEFEILISHYESLVNEIEIAATKYVDVPLTGAAEKSARDELLDLAGTYQTRANQIRKQAKI